MVVNDEIGLHYRPARIVWPMAREDFSADLKYKKTFDVKVNSYLRSFN